MDFETVLYLIAMGIYILYQIGTPKKKKAKNQQLPQQPQQQRPTPQVPKKPVQPRPQVQQLPKDPNKKPSFEDIFRELTQQPAQEEYTEYIEPAQPIVVPKEEMPKKVFSYDDYYESEEYNRRHEKEMQEIHDIRIQKKHLSNNIHDEAYIGGEKKKKRKRKGPLKNFKFNAKDAVIYDVILNIKYK